jgi:hypothetical protein
VALRRIRAERPQGRATAARLTEGDGLADEADP